MSRAVRALAAAGLLLAVACQTGGPPLRVVSAVDLHRYAGRWYEIASFPQRFQRGCVATTATYTRLDDTRLQVVNECRDRTFDGELRRAVGHAWIPDPDESPAKLKVRFFWPFRGDYWILELDPDYRYAVVGHPSRDYLWILSRTPTLEPATLDALRTRLADQGFDLGRLRRTPQPPGPPPSR